MDASDFLAAYLARRDSARSPEPAVALADGVSKVVTARDEAEAAGDTERLARVRTGARALEAMALTLLMSGHMTAEQYDAVLDRLEPERTRGVVVAAGAVQVPITVEREGPTETVIDTPRPGRMIIKKKPAV